METKVKSWKVVKNPELDKYELHRKVLLIEEAEEVYLGAPAYHCRCEAQAMADYLNRKEREKKKTDSTAMESVDVR